MICFVSVAFYAYHLPYAGEKENTLALLCQVQIFFTLLSAIAINAAGGSNNTVDGLLTGVLATVAGLACTLVTPADFLLSPSKQAKACEKLLGLLNKLKEKLPKKKQRVVQQAV
jgi:hypothetical protein